jgi:Uma2 family endonuclease
MSQLVLFMRLCLASDMRAATAIAEMAFVSTETFTQKTFKQWVDRRPMTDVSRYELIDGRIVMSPPAGWGHGEIETNVIYILQSFVSQHNLGKVFGSSTGYDLPSGDTVEPDASFISHERWAAGPQVRRGQFLRIVPNLVIEILSPATARRDRTEKKKLYESNGVDEYWLIDQDAREVTVFRLVAGRYDAGTRFSVRRKLRSTILPEFAVPARSFFA